MHKFIAILTSVLFSIPAYSAGLGFNPFERSSPTSATGAGKSSPASPSPVATPAPKAAPSPVAPTKHDAQIQKPSNSQNKK